MQTLGLLVGAMFFVTANAQCQANCPTQPLFAFQADIPARFSGLRDSTRANAPKANVQSQRNIIQFVVDSTGAVDDASFKVLRGGDVNVVERARAALPNWIFSPAKLGACNVSQIVQMDIE